MKPSNPKSTDKGSFFTLLTYFRFYYRFAIL